MINLKTSLATAAVLAFASGAFAAGYQIVEQGASNMGTAMAGATVNANNDASAAFWNPSATSFMGLDVGKTRMDSVLSIVVPTLCVNNRGSTPEIPGTDNHGTCGTNELVPNFFLAHRLSEDFTVTLSVTAPYGLESKYNTNWFGKYQAERSYLFTTDVNPSIAYKVTDWLSISGGVSGQFAYCSLSQFTPMGMMDLTGESFPIGKMFGYWFPKGTPQEIIDKFNDAVEKAVSSDEFKEHCANYYVTPAFKEGADAVAYLDDYYAVMQEYKDQLLVQ